MPPLWALAVPLPGNLFVQFSDAVFRHLACLACGQAAWCRDMLEGAEDQDAAA